MAKAKTSAKTSDPGMAEGDDQEGHQPAVRINLDMDGFEELKDLQGPTLAQPWPSAGKRRP